MNKERLLKLAAFLETVPERKFDIQSWRCESNEAGASEFNSDLLQDQYLRDPDCGTTGCAVGWACSMPEFQAEGFIWTLTGPGLLRKVGGISGWPAVRAFFDLVQEDATALFDEYSYTARANGPKDVAQRIREMVAGEEA